MNAILHSISEIVVKPSLYCKGIAITFSRPIAKAVAILFLSVFLTTLLLEALGDRVSVIALQTSGSGQNAEIN